MTEISGEALRHAIESIEDPHTGATLGQGKSISKLAVEGARVTVEISLGYPAGGWHGQLEMLIRDAVGIAGNAGEVDVAIGTKVVAHEVQKGVTPIKGVKNIIAVASGKGGVGKSTVSSNLALALAAEGAAAGILDADIYGPSQPRMLGISGRPQSADGKSLEPMISYGLQAMSIGFLIDEDTPMIWRGPMVTQALEQLLNDTRWRDLDYLVIDLPPGTGDTQLTLAQKVPVSGAAIVTTPQDIALLDARKALKMFEKVEIPVLGVIENMNTHICSQCGHEEAIFGAGGGERMAAEYGVDILGGIPLDIRIREDADGGRPTVVADPDGPVAANYRKIARQAAGRLAARKRSYSEVFPSIVVQNT
ncbi:MAG: iron-sulfur cluster carrier protein ApbC [Acidiferrobacteraceae bacterium]|nr:iron-sulfur cluster carrier protein ApbC [Acidiferrobacteraceae bacterium]MDP6552414.1 iron-sulfur cluster carrier protein ApbC [Arenicellales bacterium]MDP6790298.1 iron-sulfur cluster carrier protein ApbC [Arenicellales bacterium]MDP6918228.1 iron-sulfur cluster carrier protein ApbC [Arenicellales bacterium]